MSERTHSPSVPSAAIIIPHHNDVDRLMRCLDALMPQIGEGVDLIVVDNGSTDDLSPLRARWPNLRIAIESRKGAACARNRGVSETSAPHLYFLDCDCVPASDWLATAHWLSAEHSSDIIGGKVRVFDETPPPRNGPEAFETVFAFDNRDYVLRKGFSVTANLLTRRDVFEATGPFRPGLSEDLDWCRRATAAGYRLSYAAELVVAHPTRSDWTALANKWQRLTAEEFGLKGRGFFESMRWNLKALAMPLSVLVHAPRILFHPTLRNGNERLGALRTLTRLRLARMIWMLRS